jgi:alpha-beta hydrolase superfamily lysophospholipase
MSLPERQLQVSVDGLTLAGGVCLADEPRAGILLLHGIPSTAPSDPEDEGYPGLARQLAAAGFSAAWLNMRAAKGQPGFFSIEGWVHDATAAMTAVAESEFRRLPLIIAGSSAGGAVAAEVARREPVVDGLILLAAPAEWVSFAAHPEAGVERITQDARMAVAPEVHTDPSAWGAEFRQIATEEAIGGVRSPILILHGDEDAVVPPEHAATLYALAPQAELHMISGAGHQLRRDPGAVQLVLDWLDRMWP